MTGQQLNYERIASAIRFIKENRREQPKLEEVAKHVHMSPYHFQRIFQEISGMGRNISQTFSAIPERGICQTYPARDARIAVRHGV